MLTVKSHRRSEVLALLVVLLVVLGISVASFAYQWALTRAASQVKVFELLAQMPEGGGWQPERIRVTAGDRVRLRLYGRDVVHGFAIGRLGHSSPASLLVWRGSGDPPPGGGMTADRAVVYPGEVVTVEFTAEKPGRFTYYCDVWCSPNHWRMRGLLEVVDPSRPDEPPIEERTPDQITLESMHLDLDAPHPAAHYPQSPPSARRGRELAARLGDELAGWADRDLLRRTSPSDVFAALQAGPAAGLPADQVWDLVAFLWAQSTTPEDLAAGKALYDRNCAACHGPTGAGDGPGGRYLQEATLGAGMADGSHGAGQKQPSNFRDPQSMAGGTGWLYYGKMARGGMGTGMPYWGPIFTDRQMWQIIDYLWTFLFDYEG